MAPIWLSIAICVAALLGVTLMMRRDRISMGLPIAYLFSLNLIHVPGAYAHAMRPELFSTTSYVAIGIWQTAVASVVFALGVFLARRQITVPADMEVSDDWDHRGTGLKFWLFCLIGGWIFIYGLGALARIPSLGAIIEKGGAIWMLGTMMGLYVAISRGRPLLSLLWIAALAVYPAAVLLFSGFVSYGTAATIIVLSLLAVRIRSFTAVLIWTTLLSVLGLTFYLQYISERTYLRSVLWSSAGIERRIDVTLDVFSIENFELPDLDNERHAWALDLRLNQNYFVGLAAKRIERGETEFLHGQTIYDALLSLVPRAIWSDKPVYGGSGTIVVEATGLLLARNTSWGAGQVMELYINFGWYSLIAGFLILGYVLGTLDMRAAIAERSGNGTTAIIWFLPAVALIQPNGSLVELVSGAAAALVAALGWRLVWIEFVERRPEPVTHRANERTTP